VSHFVIFVSFGHPSLIQVVLKVQNSSTLISH